MGENVRRRGYGYNRVLIESARILDPQFEDAVVFLSAAQIELLRNVTQYLNRLGTYAAEYNPGYYLVPTDEDFDDILEIVADLEETLMGNPNTIWGYKERLSGVDVVVSTGDPYTDATTDDVPAGYIHVVEQWSFVHWDIAAKGVLLQTIGGDASPVIYTAPNLSPSIYVYQPCSITLSEGDTLRLRVYNLGVDKACNLAVWGHKMKVPE